LARLRVEPADVLGRRFLRDATVTRSRGVAGDDHHVADDQRSGAVVEAAGQRLVVVEVQARPSAIAEVPGRLACLRAERVQLLAANGEAPLAPAAAPVVDAACALSLQLFFGPRERFLLPHDVA